MSITFSLHDYFSVLTILFSENGGTLFLTIGYSSKVKWPAAGNFFEIGTFQCQKRPLPLEKFWGAFRILGGRAVRCRGPFSSSGPGKVLPFYPPLSTALLSTMLSQFQMALKCNIVQPLHIFYCTKLMICSI